MAGQTTERIVFNSIRDVEEYVRSGDADFRGLTAANRFLTNLYQEFSVTEHRLERVRKWIQVDKERNRQRQKEAYDEADRETAELNRRLLAVQERERNVRTREMRLATEKEDLKREKRKVKDEQTSVQRLRFAGERDERQFWAEYDKRFKEKGQHVEFLQEKEKELKKADEDRARQLKYFDECVAAQLKRIEKWENLTREVEERKRVADGELERAQKKLKITKDALKPLEEEISRKEKEQEEVFRWYEEDYCERETKLMWREMDFRVRKRALERAEDPDYVDYIPYPE